MHLPPAAFALLTLVVAAIAAPACARPPLSAAPARAVPRAASVRPFDAAAIDAALREAWRAKEIDPAPRSDDATFLRRVYLDVIGTVPTSEATARFLGDRSPDKRQKLVDELVASPAYADHWMSYWDDVLMGRETRGNVVDRVAFRAWLRARFAANARWNEIARELVSATGRNSDGGLRQKGPPLAFPPAATKSASSASPEVNGAVNFTLRFAQSPQDLAGNASRLFLGVQIQCAQCHDHKTEQWTQEDFRRFASAFLHTKVEPIDRGRSMGAIKRVELADAPNVARRFAKKPETSEIVSARPTALDGTKLDGRDGTRKALAAWMTSEDNPWFARAFVNRMWAHFLGRGFVDPVDDFRSSNPGVLPELLDRIAADFAAHGFDVARLVRTICATEAYQLAASPRRDPAAKDPENALWARFHLVPLGPEELLNALVRVTGTDLDRQRTALLRRHAFLFEVDETDDEPDYSGTVSQALALLNGALVAKGTTASANTNLAKVLAMPGGNEEKVDALTRIVLARSPTLEERAAWVAYVEGSPGPPRRAYEDLLWAMLCSSEFVINH